jgi:hypothetical protein
MKTNGINEYVVHVDCGSQKLSLIGIPQGKVPFGRLKSR